MIVLSKFLLIIMSAAVLLLGGQQIIGNNILERGPVAVLADEDNCANDSSQLGCDNPGTDEGGIVPDVPAPAPAPEPLTAPSCQEQRREYPQCGGTTGLEDFPSTDTIMVTEITDCDGNKRYENNNLGNLGQCQVFNPPVTSQPPVQQPPVRSVPAANMNANVNNNVVYNSVQNTVNQNQSQTNNQTQTVTVQQPSVQGGLSVRFATVDCPVGTTKKVSGNEIICEVIVQPRVEVAAAKVEVKELPKTGLPLLAWAAGAFIPAGLGLKRFGKGISFDMEDNANYLWEERQYKAGA